MAAIEIWQGKCLKCGKPYTRPDFATNISVNHSMLSICPKCVKDFMASTPFDGKPRTKVRFTKKEIARRTKVFKKFFSKHSDD